MINFKSNSDLVCVYVLGYQLWDEMRWHVDGFTRCRIRSALLGDVECAILLLTLSTWQYYNDLATWINASNIWFHFVFSIDLWRHFILNTYKSHPLFFLSLSQDSVPIKMLQISTWTHINTCIRNEENLFYEVLYWANII